MRKSRRLAREVALVGAGMSKFGTFPEHASADFFREALLDLQDTLSCELDRSCVEALYVGNFSNDVFVGQSHWGALLAEQAGLNPIPATRVEGACASGGLAIREAVFAIAAGFYDVVLVAGLEQMSRKKTSDVAAGLMLASGPQERAAGFTFPAIFAAHATAYFDRYDADRRCLFDVAVKNHRHAARNPKAQFPWSIAALMEKKKAASGGCWPDEYAFLADDGANPEVAYPLHLFDCSPISDGSACLLFTAASIARRFTDTALHVRGLGQASGSGFSETPLGSFPATKFAAHEAFSMAELQASDIQFAEVHDCFTIAEVVHLEDLGFFPPGEGQHAAGEKITSIEGAFPVNTSGGLKCKGHPVGASGVAQVVELWTQLRQRAEARQIPRPDLTLGAAHSLGGTGGTCTVTILERRE